jgi:hypothetical protein
VKEGNRNEIEVFFTEEERVMVEAMAEKEGVSVNDFVRSLIRQTKETAASGRLKRLVGDHPSLVKAIEDYERVLAGEPNPKSLQKAFDRCKREYLKAGFKE